MNWNSSDSKDPLDHFLPYYGKVLFDNPALAFELLEDIAVTAKKDSLTNRKILIVSAALDEARNYTIDGRKRGAEFVESLERQLEKMSKENLMTHFSCLMFSQYWRIHRLKPPDSLYLPYSEMATNLKKLAKVPELVEAYRQELEPNVDLQKADGLRALIVCYRSILPTLPEELRSELARAAVSCDNEAYEALGCSLLLMYCNSVNRGVIDGFYDRLQIGSFSDGLIAKLIAVRYLTNDSSTITSIDQLIKSATNNGIKVVDGSRNIKFHDIIATHLDAAGMQAVISTFQNGKTRYAVMLILIQGLGVASVDLVQCASAAIQQETLEEFQDTLFDDSYFDVSIEFVSQVTSVALHDGYQNKILPHQKMFELVQVMGLSTINPLIGTVEDLLSNLDPEKRIASKPSKEFERLIADSAHWEKKIEILNGWYQKDDEIIQVLKCGKPKEEVWPILESKRTHWAMCVGRTAMLLKEVNDSETDSFVAVLVALASGRDLKKIPAMKKIFNRTIEECKDTIADYDAVRPRIRLRKPTKKSKDYMKISEIDILLNNFYELFLSPEEPLPARIWVKGYLAAIQTVPAQIPHHLLLNELLQRFNMEPEDFDEYDYDRLSDLLFLAVESTGKSLCMENDNHLLQLEEKDLAVWVSGYLAVWKAFPMYWPDELLGKAGRQAITIMEAAEQKKLESTEPLTELFQWLCKCCAIRQNSNIPPPGITMGSDGTFPMVMSSL